MVTNCCIVVIVLRVPVAQQTVLYSCWSIDCVYWWCATTKDQWLKCFSCWSQQGGITLCVHRARYHTKFAQFLSFSLWMELKQCSGSLIENTMAAEEEGETISIWLLMLHLPLTMRMPRIETLHCYHPINPSCLKGHLSIMPLMWIRYRFGSLVMDDPNKLPTLYTHHTILNHQLHDVPIGFVVPFFNAHMGQYESMPYSIVAWMMGIDWWRSGSQGTFLALDPSALL